MQDLVAFHRIEVVSNAFFLSRGNQVSLSTKLACDRAAGRPLDLLILLSASKTSAVYGIFAIGLLSSF